MTSRLFRSAAIALATVTSAAVLGACGGGDDDAMQPAAATTFNPADVTFAQQMIPHHSQAVKMASLAATRAKDPAVKKLAARMEMSAGMPGMASEDDLETLAAAKGAQFDQTFLTMMIKHHRGALQMARTVRADGRDPEALTLAEAIQTAQQSEIKRMQNLQKK